MEETTQTSAEPSAAPQEASPLETVYKEYGIEEQAASFQPQAPAPAPQPAPAPAFKAPDPFDPGFQAYQSQLAHGVGALQQALTQTRGELTQLQASLQSQRTEADIKQAVGVLTDVAKIPPKIAEVAMEAKAREDKRFLQIWNNRQNNPKAFNAALKALGSELQEQFTVRQDPQLAENQRAVAASRNSMATTAKTSENDKWGEMTPAERQRAVQVLLRDGGR